MGRALSATTQRPFLQRVRAGGRSASIGEPPPALRTAIPAPQAGCPAPILPITPLNEFGVRQATEPYCTVGGDRDPVRSKGGRRVITGSPRPARSRPRDHRSPRFTPRRLQSLPRTVAGVLDSSSFWRGLYHRTCDNAGCRRSQTPRRLAPRGSGRSDRRTRPYVLERAVAVATVQFRSIGCGRPSPPPPRLRETQPLSSRISRIFPRRVATLALTWAALVSAAPTPAQPLSPADAPLSVGAPVVSTLWAPELAARATPRSGYSNGEPVLPT